MAKPTIFVFSGTSGSGRKTVAKRIGEALNWVPVRSCTTRPPRDPDLPDGDYHYVSVERFAAMEQDDEFVQMAEIDKNKYGILRQELESSLTGNANVYLILNREGAAKLKQLYGDRVVRIFLYVDKQTVRERLESKGTRYEVIEHYLDHYMDEVTYRKQCEHVFENLDLKRTVDQIREAVKIYER
jgi:guanylate kinase